MYFTNQERCKQTRQLLFTSKVQFLPLRLTKTDYIYICLDSHHCTTIILEGSYLSKYSGYEGDLCQKKGIEVLYNLALIIRIY